MLRPLQAILGRLTGTVWSLNYPTNPSPRGFYYGSEAKNLSVKTYCTTYLELNLGTEYPDTGTMTGTVVPGWVAKFRYGHGLHVSGYRGTGTKIDVPYR